MIRLCVWLKNIVGKLNSFLLLTEQPPLQKKEPISLNLTTGNNARFIREFLNSESLFLYPKKHNSISQFCSCLDYLQDIDTGLMETISHCQGTSYQKFISLFGILQALFVKHDTVKNLFESLEEKYENEDDVLKNIRDLRNLTVGHPTKKELGNGKGIVKYSQIDIHSCCNLPASFKFLTYAHNENEKPKNIADYFEKNHIHKEIDLLQTIKAQDAALAKKLKDLQRIIVEKENEKRKESIPIISNIKEKLLEANSLLDSIKENPIDILQKIEENLSYLNNELHDDLNIWENTSINFRKQNISGMEQLKKIYTNKPPALDITDFCIFASFIANKCNSLNNTDRFLLYLTSKLPVHIEQVTTKNEGLNCFISPLQVLKGHLQSNYSANIGAQKIIKVIIKLEQAITNYDMQLNHDDTKIYLHYLQNSINKLILDSKDLLQTLEKKCSICD